MNEKKLNLAKVNLDKREELADFIKRNDIKTLAKYGDTIILSDVDAEIIHNYFDFDRSFEFEEAYEEDFCELIQDAYPDFSLWCEITKDGPVVVGFKNFDEAQEYAREFSCDVVEIRKGRFDNKFRYYGKSYEPLDPQKFYGEVFEYFSTKQEVSKFYRDWVKQTQEEGADERETKRVISQGMRLYVAALEKEDDEVLVVYDGEVVDTCKKEAMHLRKEDKELEVYIGVMRVED